MESSRRKLEMALDSNQNVLNGLEKDVEMQTILADERKRAEIAEKWSGVHNFVPQYRGPCFTMPFNGEHPKEIRDKNR